MAAKQEGPVSPDTLIRFGAELRLARIAKGLSQEQLGAMCSKTTADGKLTVMYKSEVSMIERGMQHNVEFATLGRLAAAVGMDIDLQLSPVPTPARKKRTTKS